MCGIAGIVHPRAGLEGAPSCDAAHIDAMTDALMHRGPDGRGVVSLPGIALGHRRLSIIDLAGGHQPMSDDEGQVCVTYNGEIYNHLELRNELEDLGCRFQTSCDTEVLVHGYRHWGLDLLERIEGMFAFAIWDAPKRRLVMARDRMGQKPLYYTLLKDKSLLFASEIKALLAHPGVERSVDQQGLAAYLTHEYLPGDLSIIKGVSKLLPGHVAVFSAGEFEIKEYWDIPFVDREPSPDPVAEFSSLFDEAVKKRLMADVPVGVFLSGGIDSSSVAAAAVRASSHTQVKTFSIGFQDPSYDESQMAQKVADHLKTDHHTKIFLPEQMLEVLPHVLSKLDEPLGDASLLPTTLLSEFTREHVTVALGGDGGDELLLGYPTFVAERAAQPYTLLPAWFRKALTAGSSLLPVSTDNFSFDFVVRSFLKGASQSAAMRHPVWLGSFIPESEKDPLLPELRANHSLDQVLSFAVQTYNQPDVQDPFKKLSYQYCRTYLADDILHKVDRASMSVSLEARSPFLDRKLVEFIVRLPSELKLSRRGQGKWILKQAMQDRLPKDIVHRKKKGFGIPLAAWLKGPLRHLLDEYLNESRIKSAGYFRPDIVSRLVREHVEGRNNHRKELWTLLSFEMWRQTL